MKYLYIGDIHGDYNFVKYLYDNFKNYKKIFVGDIVDSLIFTRAEQIKSLELVLQMIEEGNTECLFGNHEMSYLYPNNFKCSGFSNTMLSRINPLKSKIFRLFKYFIYDKENKILISHAGLTKQLWDQFNLSFNNLEETLNEWLNHNYRISYWSKDYEYSPYHWIGNCRGGPNNVGGLLWCDWNNEFQPIENLTQIFGHTAYLDNYKDSFYGIRIRNNINYNIDCLQRIYQILEYNTETKIFQIITINSKKVNNLNNHRTTSL